MRWLFLGQLAASTIESAAEWPGILPNSREAQQRSGQYLQQEIAKEAPMTTPAKVAAKLEVVRVAALEQKAQEERDRAEDVAGLQTRAESLDAADSESESDPTP